MPLDLKLFRRCVWRKSGCFEWDGHRTREGYGRIGLKPGQAALVGRSRYITTHRLMWFLMRGSLPGPGLGVLHRCDNRLCCNIAHLYIGTQADNVQDCIDRGRVRRPAEYMRGSAHPNSILDETLVREIRSKYATGRFRLIDLAAEYGIAKCTVSAVTTRRLWAHVH